MWWKFTKKWVIYVFFKIQGFYYQIKSFEGMFGFNVVFICFQVKIEKVPDADPILGTKLGLPSPTNKH